MITRRRCTDDSELGDGTLRMYFTLRHSGTTGSYDDIPQSWGPSGSSYWKRPSTIFVVSHDGSQWDATPSIYKTAAQLGINGWSEICALSVMDPAFFGAPDGAPGIEVLLSTRDPLLTHKLWVIGRWKHPVTSRNVKYKGPLKTESGGIPSPRRRCPGRG